MVQILRVKINWTGFVGGPGYTNLYFNEFNQGDQTQEAADGSVAKADAFVTSMAIRVPNTVQMRVDPAVDVIESTTGELVGFFTTSPAATRTGSSTGVYSGVTGACISWYTDGVRNGRRVRGRTFIVPLGGGAYGPNGTLDDATLGFMQTAANTLLATGGTGDFGVWARPTTPTAADGEWFSATAARIQDKAAVLRSRRD